MKKRFLITALIICFCGAIVSCKPKEKPEEKSKDNSFQSPQLRLIFAFS